MEKLKNPKIIYLIAVIIIALGILVTCIWKTNFTLEYAEHTRMDIYIGKDYNLDDIKQIAKEIFPKEKLIYQEIETFHDSIAIHVKEVNEEQLTALEEKIKEKYEITDVESSVEMTTVPHYRVRDMVKPYIIPMIITTLIILVYVGIRYLNLGMYKIIGVMLLRILVSEAVLASIIQIIRIPVGIWIIPIAILTYIFVITFTMLGYEKNADRKKEQKKEKVIEDIG